MTSIIYYSGFAICLLMLLIKEGMKKPSPYNRFYRFGYFAEEFIGALFIFSLMSIFWPLIIPAFISHQIYIRYHGIKSDDFWT